LAICHAIFVNRADGRFGLALAGIQYVVVVEIGNNGNAVALHKIRDDGEALEVGETLAVSVGEAGQGLLVNVFNFLQVGGDVGLGSLLSLHGHLP